MSDEEIEQMLKEMEQQRELALVNFHRLDAACAILRQVLNPKEQEAGDEKPQ